MLPQRSGHRGPHAARQGAHIPSVQPTPSPIRPPVVPRHDPPSVPKRRKWSLAAKVISLLSLVILGNVAAFQLFRAPIHEEPPAQTAQPVVSRKHTTAIWTETTSAGSTQISQVSTSTSAPMESQSGDDFWRGYPVDVNASICGTYSPSKQLVRVCGEQQLRQFNFFHLRCSRTGRWLSRPIDSTAMNSSRNEKRLQFRFHAGRYGAWSVQAHTRMHLTSENSNRITLDRSWTRGYEMWMVAFGDWRGPMKGKSRIPFGLRIKSNSDTDTSGAFIYLQSRRNGKYVVTKGDNMWATGDDVADVDTITRFEMFADVSYGCRPTNAPKKGKKITTSKKAEAGIRGDSCWGPSKTDHFSRHSTQVLAKPVQVPLFGSPPPPKAQTPLNASNPHDSVIIARRTLANWALIDGVQPFILADSKSTVDLTKSVQTDVKAHCSASQSCADNTTIDVQFEGFEIHSSYKQPTYRGLFKAAFKRYPDAPAVMYSNMDILYAPSLADTIRSVQTFVKGEKLHQVEVLKQQGRPASEYKVKGWMIVGQRINFPVPAEWSPLTNASWPSDMYTQFASQGEVFESDAEDYFVVSRGLFDWDSIPDFVVGGVAFDNWITGRANMLAEKGEAIVVDGTKTIIAVHQNHGKMKASHHHPKSQYNARLAVEQGGWSLGHTTDALVASEFNAHGIVSVYDKHRLLYI